MRRKVLLGIALLPIGLLACTSILGDFDVSGGDDSSSGGDGGGGIDGTVLGDGQVGTDGQVTTGDGSTTTDGGVDSGPKCGFPGEDCCVGPFAACNDGLTCKSGECKLSDVRLVGIAGLFGSGYGVSAHYDGTTWTKGPDLNLATSSADNKPTPTGLWSSGVDAYELVTTAGFVMPYDSTGSGRWRTCSATDANCGRPSSTLSLWGIYGFSATDYWIIGTNDMFRCTSTTCTSTKSGLSGTWTSGPLTGTSSNDLWFGQFDHVSHYNGTTWAVTSNISARGMYAKAANDVWGAGDNASLKHFDGTAWSPSYTIALPDGGTYKGGYTAMTGTASNDVWVTGFDNTGGANTALTAHWNGSAWTYVPPPVATGQFDFIWAGAHDEVFLSGFNTAFYEWNGTSWAAVTLPSYDAGGFPVTPSDVYMAASAGLRP